MAQLKERDTEETVDNQLIPEEVERLRELGVEVEESEQDGNESGGDGSSGSEDSEDPSEEESGGSGGDGEETDDTSEKLDNSGLSGDDIEELKEESDVVGEEESEDDIDEQVEAARIAGAGEGNIEMENFDSYRMNDEWEKLGKQYGRQLAGVLVDHFKKERRTGISHGEEDGHFDSNQLIEADRGSPDVFYQRNRPDEKKYHAVIAMDDSGSMGSDSGLKEACVTTGMLVHALEEAGIETTVYRFARNVRLVKSAAQSYDEVKDGIFEERTYGGTMLLPAIEQAEEIAENHADETFLVVVTDGRPSSRKQIKESLQSSDMKSITVQIKEDHEEFKGYYDGWVLVNDQSEVPSKTQSAFRRVML
jgi:hypothetical protein